LEVEYEEEGGEREEAIKKGDRREPGLQKGRFTKSREKEKNEGRKK
jgi:hypothetical protein